MSNPKFADITAAHARIAEMIIRTPVLTSTTLDAQSKAQLFFKCENLQKVGAFKFRGASNAVFALDAGAAARGVITHSSGNHGQAMALAARMRGIPAIVVVPDNAPQVKKDAIAGYGGRIIFCEPTLAARERESEKLLQSTGGTFIHPYNDPLIIAGQGTAALELMQSVANLDYVVAPVGGGGLLSGTAISVRALANNCKVIGAEPAGAADAQRSFAARELMPSVAPSTIADGLLTGLCPLTFGIIREKVEDIITVDDKAIIRAMRLIWERMKIVIEPSAAVAVAVVLSGKIDVKGKRVGIILSGGNVDLDRLPW